MKKGCFGGSLNLKCLSLTWMAMINDCLDSYDPFILLSQQKKKKIITGGGVEIDLQL